MATTSTTRRSVKSSKAISAAARATITSSRPFTPGRKPWDRWRRLPNKALAVTFLAEDISSKDQEPGALANRSLFWRIQMSATGIGASVRRKEDFRFITGKGQYTDDVNRHGQAHAAFLHSPHAHAEIVSIDTSAASAMPGVAAIFTGDDLA